MLSDYGEVYRNRPLWGEWYIGDRLGEDCCGTVHAAIRGKESTPHSTVIKVCRFPSELFYRKAVTAFGNDAGKITRYFEDTLEGIIYKLHLSSSMACHGSIVNYHDYKIDRREKGPGRIVLFRKDQVIPLDRYAQEHPLTKGEAIRLGIELCEALSYHLKGGAAQGYLRMESIFVSQEGAFKLGDTFEKDLLEGQAPALPLFAAPEVLLKENFDHTADIYTLGLILYKLFNKGCLPFLPSPSGKLQRREIKRALARRGKKEPLPSPALAGEALSALILKACAGEPSLRFSTPPEMKLALEELASDLEDEALSQYPEPAPPQRSILQGDPLIIPLPTPPSPRNQKISRKKRRRTNLLPNRRIISRSPSIPSRPDRRSSRSSPRFRQFQSKTGGPAPDPLPNHGTPSPHACFCSWQSRSCRPLSITTSLRKANPSPATGTRRAISTIMGWLSFMMAISTIQTLPKDQRSAAPCRTGTI